jgi:hypothetical protein
MAALAASVMAIRIGWRGQQQPAHPHVSRFTRLSDLSSPTATAPDQPAPNRAGDQTISDAADVIRTALERLMPAIHRQRVRLDLAAEHGHFIRLHPGLLADLLEEFITLALNAAAGRHMLLTAARSGGRVDITLSDDQPAPDASLRQSQARGLAHRVALYGGTLDIVVRASLGTTMTMKLMTAVDRPAVPAQREAQILARQRA